MFVRCLAGSVIKVTAQLCSVNCGRQELCEKIKEKLLFKQNTGEWKMFAGRKVMRLIVVLALVVVGLVLVACGGGSKLPDDPRAAVVQALKTQMKTTPFRVTMDMEYDGKQSKNIIEFVSPTRLHMNMGETDIILVDDKGYRKEDGKWIVDDMMGSIASSMSNMFNADIVDSMAGMMKEVKQVGTEDLNGQKVRVYEYTSEGSMMGIDSKSTTRIWVRESDGLPLKQINDGEAAGVRSITTQTIEYDPNIKVEAPQ
jgi:hypothetical protein